MSMSSLRASDPYELLRCAHGHLHAVEDLGESARALRVLIHEQERDDAMSVLSKQAPADRRRVASRAHLRERLRLEEEWEVAFDALADRMLTSFDVPTGYTAARWTRKSLFRRVRRARKLDADPAVVARLLRTLYEASDLMKPTVAQQIRAVTGGVSPAEARLALEAALAEYNVPTPASVAEGLGGELGAEFWAMNAAQVYLMMAMQTSAPA